MELLIVILLVMLAVIIAKLTKIIVEIAQQRSQFNELAKLIEQSLVREKTLSPESTIDNEAQPQPANNIAAIIERATPALPEAVALRENQVEAVAASTDTHTDEPAQSAVPLTLEPTDLNAAKAHRSINDPSINANEKTVTLSEGRGSIASEVEKYLQFKAARQAENRLRTKPNEPRLTQSVDPSAAEPTKNRASDSAVGKSQNGSGELVALSESAPAIAVASEIDQHSPKTQLTRSVWEYDNESPAPAIKSKSTLITWWKYVEQQFASRWMVWIGGAIMAMGVIFLVKIGNDHGLFGPQIRIGIATAIGLAMTAGGELLRRSRFHLKLASGQYIPAALSGAGIIALYASMLGANYIYAMFPLGVLFIILTVISAIAMALAIRQGPFMAALGIVGAYMVPLFISTDSGNATGLLLYVAAVSFGSLTLLNKIYRRWLWWGALAGNYSWLLVAIFISPNEHQMARGLFLLVTTYCFFALPYFGWRLLAQNKNPKTCLQDGLLTGAVAAFSLVLMASNTADSLLLYVTLWLGCTGLLLIARRIPLLSQLAIFGAASLFLMLPALQNIPQRSLLDLNLHQPNADGFMLKLVTFGSLAAIYAYFAARSVIERAQQQLMWALISTLTPIAILTMLYWYYPMPWMAEYGSVAKASVLTIASISAALWYAIIARYSQLSDVIKSIYSIAANVIIALTLSLVFIEAQLTSLLAIQMLISVGLIKWRSQFVSHWVFKGLMLIILMRLSFNPSIFEYAGSLFGLSWTVYGYGIPIICLWLTLRWLANNPIYKNTLQLAQINVIYLLGLWVNIELRHVMHGSYQISLDFNSLTDVSLHALTFGIMALAYIYRAPLSGLTTIYRGAAIIFGALTVLLTIGGSLIIYNPLFSAQNVGSLPLLNIVTAAYGLPAVMLLTLLCFWPDWMSKRLKPYAGVMVAIFGMLFITLSVRQMWHGNYLNQPLIFVGEQYFYSFAWMVTAIVLMTLAIKKGHLVLRRVSLGLLSLTIVKLFVWDMSGLTGFYRPISFIGLGICLVTIGWFYQRFVILNADKTTNKTASERDETIL